jgi:hypothetical protein
VALHRLRAEKVQRDFVMSAKPSVSWKRGAVQMSSTTGRDAVRRVHI